MGTNNDDDEGITASNIATPKIKHHKHPSHDKTDNSEQDHVSSYQYPKKPSSSITPPAHKTTAQDQPAATRQKQRQQKGGYELAIFMSAVITGTGCSILSKVLYEEQGVGMDGELHYFRKPLFQTLAMFWAMMIGVPMHWMVQYFQIPFPGYAHHPHHHRHHHHHHQHPRKRLDDGLPTEFMGLLGRTSDDDYHSCMAYITEEESDHSSSYDGDAEDSFYSHQDQDDTQESSSSSSYAGLPLKTYGVLAVLSVFDLLATALCAIGLLYLDVSVYQMLRGSCILFVALLRQYGLGEHLYKFQWMGVSFNALSVVLVGTAAMMQAGSSSISSDATTRSGALVGVLFMLAGTSVQALQFVLEEKIMVHDDVKVPPLLLFGMEGVWGFLLSVFILLPVGYYLPGHDMGGSYEDTWNSLTMLWNTPQLCITMVFYMTSIFGYNLFAVLVTFSLSSLWHSILDNFRPMTVWMTDLFIFYVLSSSTTGVTGNFGEAWTVYSWIQLAGMAVLLYGTAVYNAPDVGSILMKGQWYALGLDFDSEYSEIQAQRQYASMGSYPSLHKFLSGSIRSTSSANQNNSYRYQAGAQDLAKLISEAEQYCLEV